jgi:hypothetical protein
MGDCFEPLKIPYYLSSKVDIGSAIRPSAMGGGRGAEMRVHTRRQPRPSARLCAPCVSSHVPSPVSLVLSLLSAFPKAPGLEDLLLLAMCALGGLVGGEFSRRCRFGGELSLW